MAIEGKDSQGQAHPERIEPDLTPAPGTPSTDAPAGHHDGQLGFDPDSPDLADPQVDPTHPAKPPAGPVDSGDKRAKGEAYPPYNVKPE